jgi:hypothetical protein
MFLEIDRCQIREGHVPSNFEAERPDEEDPRFREQHHNVVAVVGDVEVANVVLFEILAVFESLEPRLSECLPFLVRLCQRNKSSATVPRDPSSRAYE